jgi:hypothetical protein
MGRLIAAQALPDDRLTFGDEHAIPPAAILIGEGSARIDNRTWRP